MKKKLCIISLILTALSILIVGCEKLDNITRRERTNKNTDLKIEISNSTITMEEGDYAEVEIENFNDLKQIDIEVKDNNIIKAELDKVDGTINIECLKEGKTQINISAKNCEDVSITVKVNKAEIEITPIESNTSNTNSTLVYEHYSAEIPYSGWSTLLEIDESDPTSKAMLDLFKDNNITITIEMNFNIDGSGQLIFDTNKVMNQMVSVLQDENTYNKFIETSYNAEVDKVTKEEFLSMHNDFIDILLTDEEPITKNFNWSYEDDMLTIEYIDSTDVNSNICYVNSDGSFSYCMSDLTTWLIFEPVK